jgi:hypothetical protein
MAIRLGALWLLALARAEAQIFVSDDRTTRTDSTLTLSEAMTPTGIYQSFSSQSTQHTNSLAIISDLTGSHISITDNATTTPPGKSSRTVTFLTGSARETDTRPGNGTLTTISPTPQATNTQPCNNYVEFCSRKYSNITEVACHNSPFITPNNIAANQQYDAKQQLDDGVRFLQAQIQWPTNGTEPHFCHTTCDVLDAGPITDWLASVKDWVAAHPYDVVTILLGNGN